jgi:hypothetical protein
MIVVSGVFRSFLSKKVKKNLDQKPVTEDEDYVFNNNINYEKETKQEEEKKPDLFEMFEEFSLKRKNEVYNKDTYINRNTISYNTKEKEEVIKEQENREQRLNVKEKQRTQFDKERTLYTLHKNKDEQEYASTIKKQSALDRIKKLSYFKQAIVLSEILGPPKGLDL